MIIKPFLLAKKVYKYQHLLPELFLIHRSGLFDKDWYLARNPDVAMAKNVPIFHYLLFGGFEGRDPGPDFSSKRYLETYEDVNKSGINPLIHFIRYGKKEGRRIYPSQTTKLRTLQSGDLFEKRLGNIRCDPIIVHQMGKVGSQTVVLSLMKAFEALGIEVPVYHTHALDDFELGRQLAAQEQNPESMLAVYEHGEYIRKHIDKYPTQHWNIISLVRDPISRNVAAFFQKLPEYIPDWRERYATGTLNVQDVQALFLRVTDGDWGLDYWFDSQVKSIPAFGIDVYATPFPHNRGYKIYPGTSQASLLLIRLENLQEYIQSAMHEFLGLEKFTLHNTNLADDKDYSGLYRDFRDIALPVEYVDRIYRTRFARHFYSDVELDVFAKRWKKSIEIENDTLPSITRS